MEMSPPASIRYCAEVSNNITVDPLSEFTRRPTGALYQHYISFLFFALLVLFVAVFFIFKYVHPNRKAFHRIQGRSLRR
jgi:hypothetical protein